ncbi:MAG: metalloregulator ArsR/SmtB family transcription factor [Nitrososphaerota archaeon]
MRDLEKFKARIFRALSDPIRLKILECLRSGEKCVCEIVSYVGITQPVVSRHLAILKRCGIVVDRKERNKRFYSVNNPAIFNIIDMIDKDFMDALVKHVVDQLI